MLDKNPQQLQDASMRLLALLLLIFVTFMTLKKKLDSSTSCDYVIVFITESQRLKDCCCQINVTDCHTVSVDNISSVLTTTQSKQHEAKNNDLDWQ
jgi:hypothetical protein